MSAIEICYNWVVYCREAGGIFGKKEAAEEERYFYELVSRMQFSVY